MNWLKFRLIYFLISGIAIALSCYAILSWKFRPSIDFTGGSVVELQFEKLVAADLVKQTVEQNNKDLEIKDIKTLTSSNIQFGFNDTFASQDANNLAQDLAKSLNQSVTNVRFENVGPTFSQEILKKTYTAVVIAAVGILILIAIQFRDIRFGAFAIVALIHDLTILLGAYAFLGHFKGIEVNILVVTAFLTTLSLSLYDTIVVYDRMRESMRRYPSLPLYDIANKSITETIVRSLNTSLAASFLLLALFLFGGESIKWFVLALLIGTITGTYSSPFVAVPFLVTWEKIRETKFRIKR